MAHPSLSEGLECYNINTILQSYAQSIALDEYALKSCLDIQNGALGAEEEPHDELGNCFVVFAVIPKLGSEYYGIVIS